MPSELGMQVTLGTPALRKPRKEHCLEFETSLFYLSSSRPVRAVYIVEPCLKQTNERGWGGEKKGKRNSNQGLKISENSVLSHLRVKERRRQDLMEAAFNQ